MKRIRSDVASRLQFMLNLTFYLTFRWLHRDKFLQ